MATKHRRIAVTKTPELAAALRRGRGVYGNELAESRLLAKLAVRGAEDATAERQRDPEFRLSFARFFADLDADELRRARRSWHSGR